MGVKYINESKLFKSKSKDEINLIKFKLYLGKKLIRAIYNSNFENVKTIFNLGIKLLKADLNRALARASIIGDIKIGKLILDNGADVNAKNNSNETCLIIALRNRRKSMIKLLLDYGADINVSDFWGKTFMEKVSHYDDILELLKNKRYENEN